MRRYTDALDRELRRLGHGCVLLYDGDYRDKWTRADGLGAGVYLNCHVNLGGGDRGLVLHDHRGARGWALAEVVAGELCRALGWRSEARACRPDTNGVPRDADYSEAFGTIAGVRAVALWLEP